MNEPLAPILERGLEAHESGRFEEAASSYREALRHAPQDPMVWGLLGAAELGAGRLDEADEALAAAARLDPRDPAVALQRGIVAAGRGRWSDAEAHLRLALELDPTSRDAWRTAGLIAAVVEDSAGMRRALESLEAHHPEAPELPWLHLVANSEGVAIDGDPATSTSIAEVLFHWHRPDLAMRILQERLARHRPDRAARLLALRCLDELEVRDPTRDLLERLLDPPAEVAADPELAVAQLLVDRRHGASLPAIDWAETTSRLPAELRRRVASRLISEKRWDEALAAVPTSSGDDASAMAERRIRGEILFFADRHDEAVETLSGFEGRDDLASRLLSAAAVCIPIPSDEAQIAAIREDVRSRVEAIAERLPEATETAIGDAFGAIGRIPFFHLAYHGMDDLAINRRIGAVHAGLAARRLPELAETPPRRRTRDRVRLGIVSAHLGDHSVWKTITRGWLEELDPERFEVHLFDLARTARFGSEAFPCVQSIDSSAAPPEEWARRIRRAELDVVLHPEIGMHGLGIKLAALRLAPVQAMAWGHPVTSGLPTIDLHLSPDAIEPPDAERHHAERLVRVPGLGMGRRPAASPPEPRNRAELGLASDDVALWCCQSLFKYMPIDDRLLVELALRLPQARFVMCRTGRARVDEAHRRRLAAAFARAGLDADHHLRLLPRLRHDAFLATGRACDLYLDSLAWSGGVTSMECLEAGIPAVTTPGRFMRARQTAAFLRHIGLEDAVAADREALVELVVSLAGDADRLEDLRIRTERGVERLADDARVVPFLERVLAAAAEAPDPRSIRLPDGPTTD